MAITPISEKQNLSQGPNLWWLWLILVLAIGCWLFWKFGQPVILTKEPKIEEILPAPSRELLKADLNLEEIFNNPIFQNLVSHIEWPPSAVPLGKPNPFEPTR